VVKRIAIFVLGSFFYWTAMAFYDVPQDLALWRGMVGAIFMAAASIAVSRALE